MRAKNESLEENLTRKSDEDKIRYSSLIEVDKLEITKLERKLEVLTEEHENCPKFKIEIEKIREKSENLLSQNDNLNILIEKKNTQIEDLIHKITHVEKNYNLQIEETRNNLSNKNKELQENLLIIQNEKENLENNNHCLKEEIKNSKIIVQEQTRDFQKQISNLIFL